jgi:UDP-N-acetylmuramate: L-alanyl-gamma-D-glutamyl-meso-diaminopimelate ligase
VRVHLISIGGAVMHNLALALHHMGHKVTGSDDEIFEPSKSRLQEQDLLPKKFGWDATAIDESIDMVILGMHAKADNPEMLRALELNIPCMSFPEFVAHQSKDKKRIVVGGSHGKTTTTAMIMHVLKHLNKDFDYLVGSILEGFDRMVQLSDAPLIVIEGDEYLSSALDLRPKFLWYNPHIAILTGIAWDHINVFPTFSNYCEQFHKFAATMTENDYLIYYKNDPELEKVASNFKGRKYAYAGLEVRNLKGNWGVQYEDVFYPMAVFGDHNFQNMHSAVLALEAIGISIPDSLNALNDFKSTARRLELLYQEKQVTIYRDFAHSPSKVKATVDAVRKSFPEHELVAVLELHTFSSLNKQFLPEYKNSMSAASKAYVYFDNHVFEMKKLTPFGIPEVEEAFVDVRAFDSSSDMLAELRKANARPIIYLMMSSGNFGGIKLPDALLV